MLCREIIVVCFQIHKKHINTLCGQNVELLNVKTGGHTLNTGLSIIRFADYFDPEYGGITLLRNVGMYQFTRRNPKDVDPVNVRLRRDIWAMCETTARSVLT
jgi:hypothetical protein